MLKVSITSAERFQELFEHMGRGDQFSREGFRLLFEYYDSMDFEIECDVIAICCECCEYEALSDLAQAFGCDQEDAISTAERRSTLLRSSNDEGPFIVCLLYTSPSPRDLSTSRMPSSA